MFHFFFRPDRSANAAKALRVFNRASGSVGRAEDVEMEIVALISGLLHLSDKMGLKAWEILKAATSKYDAEKGRDTNA